MLVSGASKSFSWTGGRIGWALFPTTEEAEVFKNLNINYFSCVSPYNQEGARLGLESPPCRGGHPGDGGRVPGAPGPYRERAVLDSRDPLPEAEGRLLRLSQRGRRVRTPGDPGGFPTASCRIRKKTTPSTLLQMFLLFEYQVATMDRKSFGRIGTENMHFLRLSIATDMDSLKQAVSRIREAATDEAGFARFMKRGENLY